MKSLGVDLNLKLNNQEIKVAEFPATQSRKITPLVGSVCRLADSVANHVHV